MCDEGGSMSTYIFRSEQGMTTPGPVSTSPKCTVQRTGLHAVPARREWVKNFTALVARTVIITCLAAGIFSTKASAQCTDVETGLACAPTISGSGVTVTNFSSIGPV